MYALLLTGQHISTNEFGYASLDEARQEGEDTITQRLADTHGTYEPEFSAFQVWTHDENNDLIEKVYETN